MISTTSCLETLRKVGSFSQLRTSSFEELRNSRMEFNFSGYWPMQYDVHWSRTTQLGVGSLSHSIARVPPSLVKGRILGIMGRYAEQTTSLLSAPSSIYFIRIATRSLQEKSSRAHAFVFFARIQAVGLSFPPAE